MIREYQNLSFEERMKRHQKIEVVKNKAVIDLAHALINNIGSLYSQNRLTGYLNSLGHRFPKALVGEI